MSSWLLVITYLSNQQFLEACKILICICIYITPFVKTKALLHIIINDMH